MDNKVKAIIGVAILAVGVIGFNTVSKELNDSLLSETFQCFIYGRMLLSFIIHLTCSSFPVVMYRQIQFYHSAIVYCLKPAQWFNYFYIYICYICTKKEADKFIHHLLLSWSIEFLRLCLFIYWPDFPYKSVCILCLFPYSEIFMTAVVFNRWQIYAMLLLTVSQDDVCLRTDYYKVINL